jgi:hypothetical protein
MTEWMTEWIPSWFHVNQSCSRHRLSLLWTMDNVVAQTSPGVYTTDYPTFGSVTLRAVVDAASAPKSLPRTALAAVLSRSMGRCCHELAEEPVQPIRSCW